MADVRCRPECPANTCIFVFFFTQVEICLHGFNIFNLYCSAAAYEEFEKWQAHDALENFCEVDEDKDAQYVDLLLNPERYTGYKGKSAHRIWNSIYKENCFR